MRKITAVLAVLLISTLSVFSQQKLTGKVTDANGAPLAGISVKIKGTNTGTSTASDGSFSLDGKSDAILEFSGVGFESTSARVSGGTASISLKQDTRSMSEVVVTGVGSATSKRKVAIDVATLSTKDVSKSVVGNVEQALVGKIAGANIQFQSGTPGADPTIILRGINTLSYLPPLIMVDGIEVSGLGGLDLSTVDRVEVVKGAAGGMLYGAQGANGVIQVFTKKGAKNKKMEINVLSQASRGVIIRDKDIIADHHSFKTNADGYITQGGVRIEADPITGAWPKGDFISTSTDPLLKQDKPYAEKTYDHLKQAYNPAYTFNNSVNILGGGDKTDYSLTVSQYNEQNVMSNKYSRTNVSANLGFELAKGLTLRNNLQTIFTNENLASGDADASIGATNPERFSIVTAFPHIDFLNRDANGKLVVLPRSDDPGSLNPLSENEWRDRSSKTYRIIENANINYKFPRFVELDYKYGVEFRNIDDKSFYFNQESSLQAGTAYWGQTVKGMITNTYTNHKQQNSLATVYVKTDFEKDFNLKTPIKTVTQVSYDYRRYDERQYYAKGSELPAYPPYNIGVATTKTALDFYSTFITFGTLFNQSIDYKDMIGISGGFRSDFSSNFGAGQKAATFPRGAIYFRPTEVWNLKSVSEWKLRAAYAEAGIQPSTYSRQNTFIVAQLGDLSTISTSSIYANPNLTVERSKEFEIGTDMIFKTKSSSVFPKIGLSFSYWTRKTVGALQYQDLPLSSGYAKKLDNLTDIDSKGFDLSIDADVLSKKNFTWNFGYRMGAAKSKAVKIAGGADIVQGIFTVRQGQELGLFSFQAPLSSLDQTRPNGSRYIAEADKGNYELVDGIVVEKATAKAQMTDASDAKTAGSSVPKFRASFINEFTFKQNLSFSFQWDWSYGGKIYNTTRQWLYRDRLSKDYDKAVTVNGASGAYVAYYNSLYNNVSPSTWFVENASFLRLRDVSVSYDLKNALNLNWVKALSISVSGRNLATITKYSGLDVEATTTSDSQGNEARDGYSGAINGSDYFAVPNLRSYQISLRVGL
ncbi:SusC/RagA family TonB-linked outer membrane protein [Ferruginibacter lapsinanis]|uniref:SusC/RagA family TonB-linked outer membrane protein n=1 Tax=Ferruginibacter lapsinanis TaxID=563172 RepID=UPI001E2D0336|nr:SusC/RagA family TonB-linked outer membrane protein [Ferruginibacter lapsinanis]UEG48508.1 SusC/RagA family TonB-linked outer membrane protein [Ferruginibacter lapsinanis]